MIHTVDTDVIVILVGKFYVIHERYPSANIWVAFGTGKNFLTQCGNLGKDKPHSLPTFHAFTGCDSTYLFLGKTKKSISMGSLEFLS